MRKKDPECSENIDRSVEKDNSSLTADENNHAGDNSNTGTVRFTEVKNASASGLGTMGRSDEKLSEQQAGKSNDTY